ncbi:MAG TPA: hypothetical protein VFV39_07655 [Limnobacter sp.]|nr:hypothetical protein [Limnobacter sp.]
MTPGTPKLPALATCNHCGETVATQSPDFILRQNTQGKPLAFHASCLGRQLAQANSGGAHASTNILRGFDDLLDMGKIRAQYFVQLGALLGKDEQSPQSEASKLIRVSSEDLKSHSSNPRILSFDQPRKS